MINTMTYIFNGECSSGIKQAFIDTYLQKLELVVETTADYKKSGIYSAARDDANKPIVIDWGDGTIEQINGNVSQKVHEYTTVGTFNVIVKNIKSYAASTNNSNWYQTTSQNAFTLKEVITMPDSITSIRQLVFSRCSSLISITIGNGVTSIEDSAFNYCSNLMNVIIPDSVTSIGPSVFSNCNKLTNVTIPDGVTSIGWYAFEHCSSLTSMIIGNSMTSIGNNAFSGCSGLTSVTFGNSVTTIGEYAFYGCSGLMSVIIPDSMTSIGNLAFMNCSGLTSVVFEGKTLAEVQAMSSYPWGITNTSIITVI